MKEHTIFLLNKAMMILIESARKTDTSFYEMNLETGLSKICVRLNELVNKYKTLVEEYFEKNNYYTKQYAGLPKKYLKEYLISVKNLKNEIAKIRNRVCDIDNEYIFDKNLQFCDSVIKQAFIIGVNTSNYNLLKEIVLLKNDFNKIKKHTDGINRFVAQEIISNKHLNVNLLLNDSLNKSICDAKTFEKMSIIVLNNNISKNCNAIEKNLEIIKNTFKDIYTKNNEFNKINKKLNHYCDELSYNENYKDYILF